MSLTAITNHVERDNQWFAIQWKIQHKGKDELLSMSEKTASSLITF